MRASTVLSIRPHGLSAYQLLEKKAHLLISGRLSSRLARKDGSETKHEPVNKKLYRLRPGPEAVVEPAGSRLTFRLGAMPRCEPSIRCGFEIHVLQCDVIGTESVFLWTTESLYLDEEKAALLLLP